MKKGKGFFPSEIIFSVTENCNLKCGHCYVSRKKNSLDTEKCLKFLETCTSQIEKIGFTGGEPFLNLDFILKITEFAIKKDFLFDRIMTNGVWWNDENELLKKLSLLYDSGFDGKICLSYDNFHNQNPKKIVQFIKTVLKIFGENSLEIQSVVKFSEKNKKVTKTSLFPLLEELSELLSCTQKIVFQKKSTALFKIVKENFSESTPFEIPVFIFPQSLKSKNPESFKSRKWFKEDFCEGPGNILYVHSDGNIAPCCGFSNENSELFIGTIDNSFEKILTNAKENKMISLCFTEGLSSRIKKTNSLKGKTDDICTFCDFICTSCKK